MVIIRQLLYIYYVQSKRRLTNRKLCSKHRSDVWWWWEGGRRGVYYCDVQIFFLKSSSFNKTAELYIFFRLFNFYLQFNSHLIPIQTLISYDLFNLKNCDDPNGAYKQFFNIVAYIKYVGEGAGGFYKFFPKILLPRRP